MPIFLDNYGGSADQLVIMKIVTYNWPGQTWLWYQKGRKLHWYIYIYIYIVAIFNVAIFSLCHLIGHTTYYFLDCVLVLCFFHFPSQSLLPPFYNFNWILVWINTSFFYYLNMNLSLYQNTIYIVMNLNMPTNCWRNKLLWNLSFIPLVSF